MMQVNRFSISEYGESKKLVEEIQSKSSYSKAEINDLILKCGDSVSKELGFNKSPILISSGKVRAIKFSGLIQVAPGIELEVIPKFVGAEFDSWREDFLFVATLSKHGYLLSSDNISSSLSKNDNLHNIIALSFSKMYMENRRKQIRTYSTIVEHEFAIDGEIDIEDILIPSIDGFKQKTLQFSKTNPFNAVISQAAKILLPHLTDPRAVQLIERVIHHIGPQKIVPRIRFTKLPSRSKHWQKLYDLSVDISKNLGLSMRHGELRIPGYVIDTWRCWEDLIGVMANKNKDLFKVEYHPKFKLGEKLSESTSDVNVYPDYILQTHDRSLDPFLIDAKYKTNILKGKTRISESDIYESLAFLKSSNTRLIILIFPEQGSNMGSGELKVFEQIMIEDKIILGAQLCINGISRKSHFNQISKVLGQSLVSLASENLRQ